MNRLLAVFDVIRQCGYNRSSFVYFIKCYYEVKRYWILKVFAVTKAMSLLNLQCFEVGAMLSLFKVVLLTLFFIGGTLIAIFIGNCCVLCVYFEHVTIIVYHGNLLPLLIMWGTLLTMFYPDTWLVWLAKNRISACAPVHILSRCWLPNRQDPNNNSCVQCFQHTVCVSAHAIPKNCTKLKMRKQRDQF